MNNIQKKGFTLIELLVVIGIIAILASVVIVAINPSRQFAQARNAQRAVNVSNILNAIGLNMADHNGIWTCAAGPLPTSSQNIAAIGGYDMYACIVPRYLPLMVGDPVSGVNLSSSTNYSTGYSVLIDSDNRVTVSAPGAELGENISVTR